MAQPPARRPDPSEMAQLAELLADRIYCLLVREQTLTAERLGNRREFAKE